MYRLNPATASDTSRRDLLSVSGPREKLKRGDLANLSEPELLCLILGKGSPGTPVQALAGILDEMIFQPDGRTVVPDLADCLQVKGLGFAKASAVLAGLELGKRMQTVRGRPIHCPEDALPHLQDISGSRRERFKALYLDTRRRLIASRVVSVGTLDASLVHPREVFRPAIELSASAVLVAHNHPSGDPDPSPDDLALTSRLDRAARLLGFRLVDHLIIAGQDWVSLRERQYSGDVGVELFAA
jgi:DNA repair protein RadC